MPERHRSRAAPSAWGWARRNPAYRVMHDRMPREWQPYAWYLRVPDLVAFLRHLTPVLEQRLSESIAVGHTGELKLSFYRSGAALKFAAGRITVEPWQPQPGAGGDVAFPNQTFLHLLFGHRTLDEIRHLRRDCLKNLPGLFSFCRVGGAVLDHGNQGLPQGPAATARPGVA